MWPLPWGWIWRQELEDAACVFQNRMTCLKSGADGDGSAFTMEEVHENPLFPLDSFCVASAGCKRLSFTLARKRMLLRVVLQRNGVVLLFHREGNPPQLYASVSPLRLTTVSVLA